MALVEEHGAAVVALTIDEEGQARTADEKVRIAERLIASLTGQLGLSRRHPRRLPDVPRRDRAGGDAPRRHRDDRGDPELKRRCPGQTSRSALSNVSFGLNPAARHVLNSVFLHECVEAGLDSAIVHAVEDPPARTIPEEQRRTSRSTSSTTGATVRRDGERRTTR